MDNRTTEPLKCPTCAASILVTDGLNSCGSCSTLLDVILFPVRDEEKTIVVGAIPTDATCIHHPRNKAEFVCKRCGSFVCALCRINLKNEPYCAACVTIMDQEKKVEDFSSEISRPDRTCASVIILSMLFAPLAVIGIPYAFYLLFRQQKLRKTDPTLLNLISPISLVLQWIVLCILTIAFVIIALVIIF